MRLILGSGSPRRLDLLGQLGVVPDVVCPPDIDETPRMGELPRAYCERIARSKVEAVEAIPDDIVLCADTTVARGRRILGKAADADDAARMLAELSGRRHTVITSIAVRRGLRRWLRSSLSTVKMKRLSQAEIAAYLATGDWRDKAGAYAVQGPAGALIPWIQGSYSGIMGLPVYETAQLLRAAGCPVPRPGP